MTYNTTGRRRMERAENMRRTIRPRLTGTVPGNLQDDPDLQGLSPAISNTLVEILEDFNVKIAVPNKSNCDEALKALGILTHMWQDYYSHGVKEDGWFKGDEGSIKGSPDNPQMVPDSFGWYGFRGGHGGIFRLLNPFSRVEPGDRAKDSEERRRQAVDFVSKKLFDLLPKWAGPCCCEWEDPK